VLNALDACAKLGCDAMQIDAAWAAAKKAKKLVKFGGGFYCGLVELEGKAPLYTLNAFFMEMRAKFTSPDAPIHYFAVKFDPATLVWAYFRGSVLGPTDPAAAPPDSLRGTLHSDWAALGLKAPPDVGDNGVHASASPFEGLAEKMNWLQLDPTEDEYLGKLLLEAGMPLRMLKEWTVDPQARARVRAGARVRAKRLKAWSPLGPLGARRDPNPNSSPNPNPNPNPNRGAAAARVGPRRARHCDRRPRARLVARRRRSGQCVARRERLGARRLLGRRLLRRRRRRRRRRRLRRLRPRLRVDARRHTNRRRRRLHRRRRRPRRRQRRRDRRAPARPQRRPPRHILHGAGRRGACGGGGGGGGGSLGCRDAVCRAVRRELRLPVRGAGRCGRSHGRCGRSHGRCGRAAPGSLDLTYPYLQRRAGLRLGLAKRRRRRHGRRERGAGRRGRRRTGAAPALGGAARGAVRRAGGNLFCSGGRGGRRVGGGARRVQRCAAEAYRQIQRRLITPDHA
jgi:hypothetical protein